MSNVYGPAEVNQCTRYHLDDPPRDDAPVPIGHAWDAATLRVVAADEPIAVDRLVHPGDTGVLIVATGTMMAGYWRRDDLSAASIVVDGDGTRWYVTGDLVVENADGDLVFLGRVDNQVKVRGHRIELEAIDAVLADVEGVEAATVVVDRSADDDRVGGVGGGLGRPRDRRGPRSRARRAPPGPSPVRHAGRAGRGARVAPDEYRQDRPLRLGWAPAVVIGENPAVAPCGRRPQPGTLSAHQRESDTSQ